MTNTRYTHAVAVKILGGSWMHIKNFNENTYEYDKAGIGEEGDTFTEIEAHHIAEEIGGRAVRVS
jgi:hypothetical protein